MSGWLCNLLKKKQTHHILEPSWVQGVWFRVLCLSQGSRRRDCETIDFNTEGEAWPLPAECSNGRETVAYIVEEKGIECDIWHNSIRLQTPFSGLRGQWSGANAQQSAGVKWDRLQTCKLGLYSFHFVSVFL